jgi:hypothetical protein
LPRAQDWQLQSAYCALSAADREGFDYDRLVLGAVADQALTNLTSGRRKTMFVNVGFDTFLDRHCMERYLSTLGALDQRLREIFRLMITDIPVGCPNTRLLDCTVRLRPFCSGVGFEFRTLDPHFSNLAEFGSPVVAIRLDDPSPRKGPDMGKLARLIATLHSQNSHILVRRLESWEAAKKLLSLGVDLVSMAPVPSHAM